MKRFFSSGWHGSGLVAAAFAVALLPACPPSPDLKAPDAEHYAGDLAASFCRVLKICCDAKSYPYDGASCTAQLTALFQLDADSVKRGKVVYDSHAVTACATALDAREARCGVDAGAPADGGVLDPVVSECWPVFKGTVAAGGACTTARECASSGPDVQVSCRPETSPTMPNAAATVCFQTKHGFPGAFCDTDPASHVQFLCEPTQALCDTSSVFGPESTSGMCKRLRDVGEECSGIRGGRVLCNPLNSACDSRTGTCVALPGAGQPCLLGGGEPCARGLHCDFQPVASICVVLKDEGVACEQSRECASSSCVGAIPFLPDGGTQAGACGPIVSNGGNPNDISPLVCGFGPLATGPRDAGIQAPAKPPLEQSFSARWFDAFR